MIELIDVTKAYPMKRGKRLVLDRFNLKIGRHDNVGLLGRNGAGKSTLLRIIGGAEMPDAGFVRRKMTVSWPVGFSGALHGASSGINNVKFCARIYGRNAGEVLRFVDDFSELGVYLHEPVKNYSSGMRARLAFALSMAMDFDCLLIDEVMSVGDPSFREKAQKAMEERAKDRAMVLVSHNLPFIERHSTKVVILGVQREPIVVDDVAAGIKFYAAFMRKMKTQKTVA